MRQRRLLLYGRGIMVNLHSILCKLNANSNKINYLCCLSPIAPFGSIIDYLTMTTFFEIAVCTKEVARYIHVSYIS